MIATPRNRKAIPGSSRRIDVTFIRKSGTRQDERAQIANVERMLNDLSVTIPKEYWFNCTVPRAKVSGNADFKRLRALIESDKIGTVYVESQDRWGTDDVTEFFTLVGILRAHGTRLYDLKEGMDLTATDDVTQFKTFFGGMKSKKERQDLSFRSMRSKVQNFIATASWPTGPHPFGYAKACFAADGKTLLWTWQPETRFVGQLFHADKNGKLTPGPKNSKLPRKLRGEIIRLVPSNNNDFVNSVRLIFSLFTKAGVSRRQISARLNAEGRKHYDGPFTHPIVSHILTNAAYVGDIHFGKSKTASHWSFAKDGNLERIERPNGKEKRDESEQLIRQNVHKGLITRQVWNLAQQKIKDGDERTNYSPRNPNYYLKPVLVCGHCGENVTGTMEGGNVVYYCSTYKANRSNGLPESCGAHRITHAEAEKLLLNKIKEKNLEYDEMTTALGRKNLRRQILQAEDTTGDQKIHRFRTYAEGFKTLQAYYKQHYQPSEKQLASFKLQAREYYRHWKRDKAGFTEKFRKMAQKAETESVSAAMQEVTRLSKSLVKYTEAWVDASDVQREIIKTKCGTIESELAIAKRRTKPVSQRLNEVYEQISALNSELAELEVELPNLESREKGEAYRRVFKKVSLYWRNEFIPRSTNPTRPLKTDRPGRNRFTLLKNKIEWELATPDLDGAS